MKSWLVFIGIFVALSLQGEILETERAFLVPVKAKHVKILHARLFSDPKVMATFGNKEPYPFHKTARRVGSHARRWRKDYPFSGFVAISKETRKLVGYVVCGNSTRPHCSEISYLVPARHWGKGWGTEIVEAVVHQYLPKQYAQGAEIHSGESFELLPFQGVVATALVENKASQKILQKHKFTYEETVERGGAMRVVYTLFYETPGE